MILSSRDKVMVEPEYAYSKDGNYKPNPARSVEIPKEEKCRSNLGNIVPYIEGMLKLKVNRTNRIPYQQDNHFVVRI
jgi:hypothetical protein